MRQNVNGSQILRNDNNKNIVAPNNRKHAKKLQQKMFLFSGKHSGDLKIINYFQLIILK